MANGRGGRALESAPTGGGGKAGRALESAPTGGGGKAGRALESAPTGPGGWGGPGAGRERRALWLSGLILVAVLATPGCRRGVVESVVVRGGPSLDALFADLVAAYETVNPNANVVCSFVCPPCVILRREGQRPELDVFASLGQFEIDRLQEEAHMQFASSTEVGTTRLTLVTSKRTEGKVKSFADLHRVPIRKIGVGDPDTVGVGYYAKQAMSKVGLWDELKDRFVFSQSGCELLKWLSLGWDIDAAVVLSVCLGEAGREQYTVVELPPELAAPVPLILAVAADAQNPEPARRFVSFVAGPHARSILVRHHVTPVKAS